MGKKKPSRWTINCWPWHEINNTLFKYVEFYGLQNMFITLFFSNTSKTAKERKGLGNKVVGFQVYRGPFSLILVPLNF